MKYSFAFFNNFTSIMYLGAKNFHNVIKERSSYYLLLFIKIYLYINICIITG